MGLIRDLKVLVESFIGRVCYTKEEWDMLRGVIDPSDDPVVKVVDLILHFAVNDKASSVRFLLRPGETNFGVFNVVQGEETEVMSPPTHIYTDMQAILAKRAGLEEGNERSSNQGSFEFDHDTRAYQCQVMFNETGLTIHLR